MKTRADLPGNDRPPEGMLADGTKMRVLVVDDSMFVAKQLGQILTSEGYEVVATAVDGKALPLPCLKYFYCCYYSVWDSLPDIYFLILTMISPAL